MRILLANANTTEAVTAKITAAARAAAAPGTEILGVTGGFGAQIIGTRAEIAIAGHALLDQLAEHAGTVDAVVIGVSFDVGLGAARELMPVPVVGMTEAACLAACMLGGRFGLVTYGPRSRAVFQELIQGYGLGSRLAGIRALEASPADMLADPEALYGPIAAAASDLVERDGAESVILAGAVMAGLPPLLQPRVPVPLVEGISAGIAMAEMLVGLGLPKARAGSYATLPPRQTLGLGPALGPLLAAGGTASS